MVLVSRIVTDFIMDVGALTNDDGTNEVLVYPLLIFQVYIAASVYL